VENNEYNTQYFHSKEKSRAQAKAMTTLIKDNGEILSETTEIAIEQRNFYEKLYSEKYDIPEKEIRKAETHFLEETECREVTDEENKILDSPINRDEISKALNELSNNKAPGSDGISANFYKFFWAKISSFVSNSIFSCIENKEMSIDQKRGILTLLPKKEKDCRYLKNWRPLSLLNTDYKILAKLLATRLQQILPSIINPDQTGCIKNRATFTNIRSTIDIINYAKEKNLPGIIAFIDFEKAFDTIKLSFLYKCLEKANIGKYYIDCVKTLYNDISTFVSNNGNLSQPFKPNRGIRQGCPISANLFVIVVEIMANAIRQSKEISGFKIMNEEFKIVQFADDTCIFVQNINSVKNVFDVLESFAKCAGLKPNREKTHAIGIGSSSNYRHKIGINWSDKSVKFLGVYINNDKDKMIEENYTDKLNRIQELANMWCLRKMTLKGKVTIINSLLASQLIYLGTVFHTPQWVLKKYKDIILKFLWDKKPPKIKYANIISDISEGGLKVQDIEMKLKSVKIKWLHAICDTETKCAWKKYVGTYFKDEINQILFHNKSGKDYPDIKDEFYNEIFRIWAEVHYKIPSNGEEVCRQLICNNSLIRIEGKPITQNLWKHKEINFLQNIVNKNGVIDSKENIERKYHVLIDHMLYNSIISAIPQEWKRLMKADTNVNNYFVFTDYHITIQGIEKKLIETDTKEAYWHLMKKVTSRATSEVKWEEDAGIMYDEEQWEQVYTYPYNLTKDVRILSFQYKITHRILACKRNLMTWKITNDNLCDVCEKEIDGIEHHLVACTELLKFWDSLFNWWKSVAKMSFPIDTYDIILGIPNPNNDLIITHMNYIILHAMYFIYRRKLKKNTPELYEFLVDIKKTLEIQEINMENKGQQKKFEKIWAPLLHIL
jgi:hypothetical protein